MSLPLRGAAWPIGGRLWTDLLGWSTAQKRSCSGDSITFFRVTRNSAASAPYTMRWSAVRLTFMIFCTPMRPSAVATTVGLLALTARMAAVPACYTSLVCLQAL